MSDYNNNNGGWYQHDNAENCIKFQAKMKRSRWQPGATPTRT